MMVSVVSHKCVTKIIGSCNMTHERLSKFHAFIKADVMALL